MNDRSESMDLLFVVKSTDSTSRLVEATKKREINRHAQLNASIKRKQARQRKLQPAPGRLFGNFTRREELNALTSVATQPTHGLRYDLPSINKTQTGLLLPNPRSLLDTGKLDPFNNSTTIVTPHMETVLHHYLKVLLPVVEPTAPEREDYTQWMIPLANSEPLLMYSLVFCMSQDMDQGFDGAVGPARRRGLTPERAMYKAHAFHALQECLNDVHNARKASTVFAVHFLLWQEIFRGEDEVHLDFLCRLLELRSGFQGVQRKAMEGIVLGCFWRAIRTRTKPILPRINDEFDISQHRRSQIISRCEASTAQMGQGLLDTEVTKHFDHEMIDLLMDTRTAWICFEQIGLQQYTVEERRQFTIDRSNIDHRFLSYNFDFFHEYRPIQEAVRRAFVVFSNAHYNVIHPSSKIARCLIKDLKDALEATNLRTYWGPAAETLLWALFQGAHLSFGQRERPWFVSLLAKVVSLLRICNWTQIHDVMVRFFYTTRVFQESFQRIWEEIGVISSLV